MMNNFQIPVSPHIPSKWQTFAATLRRWVLFEKMLNPFGFICFTLASLFFAFLIATKGFVIAVLLIGALIIPPLIYSLVMVPQFGILSYITLAYAIMFLLRLGVNFPLGTLMDGMLLLFTLNFFIQQKKKKQWQLLKGPVTNIITVWIVYNILEVGNPAAASRAAWVYTVRTIAVVAISYYIFIFNIRSKDFIKRIIAFWLFFSMFAAWYAFKQEYFGFFQFEEDYLHSSELIMQLLFIAGHWRKFSIFSDPVTFAYNMVAAAMLCVGMLTGPVSPKKRLLLLFIIFSCLFNMIFSGTRGAFPLVPAALVLYAIIKYSKKILIFVSIAALFIVGLIFMPTSNQNILRFQSAFRPNDDASYKVRKINQARIKPYIWSHPIGGGLGSTGEWGKKFSPGTYLSDFPPDSGYVRTTVEAGPIGLLIFCIMIFTILKTGINNYYSIQDPELKSYCLGATFVIFIFNIGNFPQEALVQFPSNVYFYLASALIVTTKRIDDNYNKLVLDTN
ncbi:O-antigen ligase family protein [Parasediminibacterium sp. JCM 36343]|uniref:O-antigen ligase family protein n=1 Tax=Parasediminibacterium sp. JCM 36343 TaxID=3374279 RepID=UPI00397C32F4